MDITLPHHTIQFGRHDREGWLKVDDQQTISGKSPGLLTVLNTDNILYVGGTEVPSGTTFENGLKGIFVYFKCRRKFVCNLVLFFIFHVYLKVLKFRDS